MCLQARVRCYLYGRYVKDFSLALHFSLYYIFLQLKINTHDEAEEQLNLSIFGNWGKGVISMGGATCVGGMVS